jgi:hypothetical protein
MDLERIGLRTIAGARRMSSRPGLPGQQPSELRRARGPPVTLAGARKFEGRCGWFKPLRPAHGQMNPGWPGPLTKFSANLFSIAIVHYVPEWERAARFGDCLRAFGLVLIASLPKASDCNP